MEKLSDFSSDFLVRSMHESNIAEYQNIDRSGLLTDKDLFILDQDDKFVSALPAPIAWSCRHSNCLQLPVEYLMLLLLENGTVCRSPEDVTMQLCPNFVKD